MNFKRNFAAVALSLAMVATPAVSAVSAKASVSSEVKVVTVKAASGTKVYRSTTVASRKKVAKKFNSKKYSVAKALKGEKMSKSAKKTLAKAKKLTGKMARMYGKKGKNTKKTKVTLKVNNLTKKCKKVYFLVYNKSAKKWQLTKAKVNYSKKTVSATLPQIGTYALVYTK
jgi:hypothetical protein